MEEVKFLDTDIDDAVVAATMTINNLTVIPEGNGESERIGRKLTIASVHIRGAVSLSSKSSAVTTSDNVVTMLVVDSQTNGAQFTATDLLETDSFQAFPNLSNSTRFFCCYREIHSMKVSGASTTGAAHAFGEDTDFLEIDLDLGLVIDYDNSVDTGAISSVTSNNLYWVTQSSKGLCDIEATVRKVWKSLKRVSLQ